MKNRIIITMVSALFITLILSSCDLFDKADDISFSTEFDESFDIMNAQDSYSETITLDATSDPEVNKYKEKIKGVTVNKITYQISNFEGGANATFSGDALFGPNGSLGSVEIPTTNLSTSTEEIELDLSQEEVDAVANQFKENKNVNVTLSGTVTNGPVSFKVTIKVSAKIEADAL